MILLLPEQCSSSRILNAIFHIKMTVVSSDTVTVRLAAVTETFPSRTTLLFNPLKLSGNNMSHLLQQSINLHFVFMCFV
jgi:hypothetical protein